MIFEIANNKTKNKVQISTPKGTLLDQCYEELEYVY